MQQWYKDLRNDANPTDETPTRTKFEERRFKKQNVTTKLERISLEMKLLKEKKRREKTVTMIGK